MPSSSARRSHSAALASGKRRSTVGWVSRGSSSRRLNATQRQVQQQLRRLAQAVARAQREVDQRVGQIVASPKTAPTWDR